MKSLFFCLIFLSSCAYKRYYQESSVGKFSNNNFLLEWVEPDLFVFRQNSTVPFYFIDSKGIKIEPKDMYTDGGSIPRPFWSIKGLSPWGYGPVYIIHDWLFEARQNRYKSAQELSFDDSVRIFREALKTFMVSNGEINERLFYYTMLGVKSRFARKKWDTKTTTLKPPKIHYVVFEEIVKLFKLGKLKL